jgi:hypothetical protein
MTDGTWRMCIDCRKLNALTCKVAYLIPIIGECLKMSKDAKWFTIIDIEDAYHHVKMAEDSIPLTAFVTNHGFFE